MTRTPKTPAEMRAEAVRLREYADQLTAEANRAADAAPGAYITGGSGRSRAQNKRTERALIKTIENAKKPVAARKRADWLEAVAADIEFGGPEKRRLARYKAREKDIASGRAKRKEMRAGELKDRLGTYAFPAGYVYADRAVEVNGDYRRLGFLSFERLILEIDKDCPGYWRQTLVDAAEKVQLAAGERVSTSAWGRAEILLGATGPNALVGRLFTLPGDETTIWQAGRDYLHTNSWRSKIVISPFRDHDQPPLWLPPTDVRQYILDFEKTLITNRYGIDQDWPIVLAAGRTYPRLAYIEQRVKE